MGSWSVASGMMLRDMLRKSDLEKERLEYEKELEIAEKEFIVDPSALGYLSSIDRAGFLRAMSKARQTFKGLNPKDKYLGMVKYDEEKKDYYLNPDFVYVVEDFYFEIKRGASREEYKRQKYEYAKKDFFNRFENNPTAFVKYPKEKFGMSKEEMFECIRRNEIICCFVAKRNSWTALKMDEYIEEVRRGNIVENYPLS